MTSWPPAPPRVYILLTVMLARSTGSCETSRIDGGRGHVFWGPVPARWVGRFGSGARPLPQGGAAPPPCAGPSPQAGAPACREASAASPGKKEAPTALARGGRSAGTRRPDAAATGG